MITVTCGGCLKEEVCKPGVPSGLPEGWYLLERKGFSPYVCSPACEEKFKQTVGYGTITSHKESQTT